MNTDLRKKSKIILKKYFFKLMNNVVFGITMENMTKHRNIKILKGTIWCQNQLSYYKVFHRKFVGYRIERNTNTYE